MARFLRSVNCHLDLDYPQMLTQQPNERCQERSHHGHDERMPLGNAGQYYAEETKALSSARLAIGVESGGGRFVQWDCPQVSHVLAM